jgi:hypothetical protein
MVVMVVWRTLNLMVVMYGWTVLSPVEWSRCA